MKKLVARAYGVVVSEVTLPEPEPEPGPETEGLMVVTTTTAPYLGTIEYTIEEA